MAQRHLHYTPKIGKKRWKCGSKVNVTMMLSVKSLVWTFLTRAMYEENILETNNLEESIKV